MQLQPPLRMIQKLEVPLLWLPVLLLRSRQKLEAELLLLLRQLLRMLAPPRPWVLRLPCFQILQKLAPAWKQLRELQILQKLEWQLEPRLQNQPQEPWLAELPG